MAICYFKIKQEKQALFFESSDVPSDIKLIPHIPGISVADGPQSLNLDKVYDDGIINKGNP